MVKERELNNCKIRANKRELKFEYKWLRYTFDRTSLIENLIGHTEGNKWRRLTL